MTIINPVSLNAFAEMSQQTYFEPTNSDGSVFTGSLGFPVAGIDGSTYTEITQVIDDPTGFQGRAYFNRSTNELVIAFTGTEGLTPDNMSAEEFLPDIIADLALPADGASQRHTGMEGTLQ